MARIGVSRVSEAEGRSARLTPHATEEPARKVLDERQDAAEGPARRVLDEHQDATEVPESSERVAPMKGPASDTRGGRNGQREDSSP